LGEVGDAAAPTVAGKAARGAAWTIGASVMSRAVGLVGTLVLIRFVAPDDYGEASAATVVTATANQLSTLGVGMYIIAKRATTRRDEVFHATAIHLFLGLIAFAAAFAFTNPLAPALHAPHLMRYIPGMLLSATIDRVSFMPEKVMVRDLQFRRVGLMRAIGELTYSGVSLGLAGAGWGGMSIVWGNVARSLVRGTIILASVKRAEWLELSPIRPETLWKIAGYGLVFAVGGLAAFASRRWDNLVVSHYYGVAVLGAYSLAYNLADTPAVYIGEQITDVMLASFAHMEEDERRRTLLRAVGVLALITYPIGIGLGAVAPTVAALFLDKRWAGAGPMLMLLSALSVVRPIYGAASSYILVKRGPRMTTLLEIGNLAVLLLALCTVGTIDPLWACASVGIVFGARAILSLYFVKIDSGITMWSFFKKLLPPLFACVPMVAAVAGLEHWIGPQKGVRLALSLAAQVATGGVVYAVSALQLARESSRELLQLVQRMLRRRRSK
jgi:PST family polysaccharide transporter